MSADLELCATPLVLNGYVSKCCNRPITKAGDKRGAGCCSQCGKIPELLEPLKCTGLNVNSKGVLENANQTTI